MLVNEIKGSEGEDGTYVIGPILTVVAAVVTIAEAYVPSIAWIVHRAFGR